MAYQALEFKDIELAPFGSDSFIIIYTQEGIKFNLQWDWYHLLFAIVNKTIRFLDLWKKFNEFRAQGFGGEIDEIFLDRDNDDIIIRNKRKQQVILDSKWIEWIKEALRRIPDKDLLDSIKNNIKKSKKNT